MSKCVIHRKSRGFAASSAAFNVRRSYQTLHKRGVGETDGRTSPTPRFARLAIECASKIFLFRVKK